MTPIRRTALLAALFCAAGALDAGAAPTPVTSCTTISAPGSYIVANDIVTSGPCFVVKADDVTLDFDGFTATGDGTGEAIAVNGTRFTVRNGAVRRFGIGIVLLSYSFLDVPGNVIERFRISDMTGWGVSGASAVVRDSLFTGNGNTAIAVNEGSLVTGNRVIGNKAGIAVGKGSTVSNNSVHSNSVVGITATCPSLLLGNTSTNHTYNLNLLGAGCVADHNAAP